MIKSNIWSVGGEYSQAGIHRGLDLFYQGHLLSCVLILFYAFLVILNILQYFS